MPKSLPYFRWYPADAETDERYASMTDAQLGFYHRCLNRSWINGGLPADLNELAATMKVSRAYLNRMWPVVGKCFVLAGTSRQRHVNPRQELERAHATAKSEAATNSVRTRYERKKDVLPRARARAESVSVSVSGSENQEETSLPEKPLPPLPQHWAVDEGYQPFVAAWREVAEVTGKPLIDEDFSDAYFRWGRLDFDHKLQATQGIKERLRLGVWSGATDPQYIPLPERYLQKEYKRHVVAPKGKFNGEDNPQDIAYRELNSGKN